MAVNLALGLKNEVINEIKGFVFNWTMKENKLMSIQILDQ